TAAHQRLRADCYRLLGDKAEAEARRRADDPKTPRLALDHFLTAERLRGEHAREPQGREKQAWTKDQEKLFGRALDAYREAVTQDYGEFGAHVQLGQGYMTLRKEDLALNALDTGVAVQPNSPWGYAYRGQVRALLRRYDKAREDLNRAMELAPDLPEPVMFRG